MADNSLEIQKALVAALRGDAAVSALVGAKVYDAVPDGTGFPYLSFGPDLGEPYDGDGFDGWESLVEIHTWSRVRGRVECKQIMAAVEALLHDQTLTLDSASFTLGRLESQRIILDPDGVTFHGIQRVRFITGT